jgi:AraC-like DNA-binding protein
MKIHFEKVVRGGDEAFACREYRCRAFPAPFHFHPEFELTVIVEGGGRRFVGDSVENFGPGDFVLLGPDLPHRWFSEPPAGGGGQSRSIVVHFTRDCFGPGFFEVSELAAVGRLLRRAGQGVRFRARLVEEVRPLLEALRDGAGPRRVARFVELLGRLAAEPSRTLASAGYLPQVGRSQAKRMERVIRFVQQRFADESLDLEAAARVAALTPSAFSRFFSRTAGKPFVVFVSEVRVSQACRLLAESDLPVADVGFACGFGALSSFHSWFRRLRGLTPRGYRRITADDPGSVWTDEADPQAPEDEK